MDKSYGHSRSAWADEDLDDFDPSFDEPLKGFESKPDKDGIKYVISYVKDGKDSTVKITKKVKEIRNVVRINKNVVNRRISMERNLGDRFHSDTDIPKLGDEISIDLPKNTDSMNLQDKDDDDDYYFVDLPSSISNSSKLSIFKRIGNNYPFIIGDEQQIEKVSYGQGDVILSQGNNSTTISGINSDISQKISGIGSSSNIGVSTVGFNSLANKSVVDAKDNLVLGGSSGNNNALGIGTASVGSSNRYQPPFMRANSSGGIYERVPSLQSSHRDECTVRVANLSEDATEEDLQELFKIAGRVVKVFLAKNKNNSKNTKGFAFITFSRREEAQNAIKKLNRHGYDNLLLNVEWAKTKER